MRPARSSSLRIRFTQHVKHAPAILSSEVEGSTEVEKQSGPLRPRTLYRCEAETACADAQAVSWLKALLLCVGWSPAEAGRVRRLVVLALNHVLRTALVEPEYLVIEIEAGHHHAQVAAQCDDALRIHLDV
jgi:hypothetical protein